MDKTVKVLVVLFAVLGIGMFGYHWFSQWHTQTVDQALLMEKEKHLDRIAQLENEINQLKEELDAQHQSQPSKTELSNVFGVAKPMAPLAPDDIDCDKITRQVVAFFQYLDSKAYLIWPGNEMRAEELFDQLSKELAASPPINVGELDHLYSLVRNVTHFYRVLGKDRVDLVKEILSSENAVLEPAMAVMFAWMTTCGRAGTETEKQPALSTLYQYAHFFLNTMGGRSYLLRRDTKQRMLINYYALLIIDMANDVKLNSYGLDIRPHLDYVFYDINNQKGLIYRQRYLTKLTALQSKYQ
jgi:hypothetical protein